MTGDGIPANPSVLNTTVLSNFAYIDQLWVVAGLSGICAVQVVCEELEGGVGDHPYLQLALDTLDDEIPVATISDTVANREAVVSNHLDPGEAQAFALADAEDGRLLTDDNPAHTAANRRSTPSQSPSKKSLSVDNKSMKVFNRGNHRRSHTLTRNRSVQGALLPLATDMSALLLESSSVVRRTHFPRELSGWIYNTSQNVVVFSIRR
ncbi:MAG: hypothetical protein J07HQX50_01796 [Haloquadratum sp. J07HQX50]|nr:MAG: hypothetical protein J07HQX50_01796 [Haloquadratum sp. J07HQX50]